ncbi:Eco57I restriction-modification methylase domain-containing protein [Thomasclavelia saccharogumia]|uniref:Eco57I restriction-modification methylase domain-containing protein n=1 Tax=Thomasclavelia saccharogumia TaxID=341225 RepID=UPI000A5095B3|nr:Eco57I restriction-modification methylase domain-containing protein [Thomasclavelia saccharogumia]
MDGKDNIQFKNAFNYKVIYAFTVNDEMHNGLIKIGDATVYTDSSIDKLSPNCRELNQAALKRIKSYTNTAGVIPVLLHTELAIKEEHTEDGSIQLKAFRDYEVHRVLENSNIHKVRIEGSMGREWFSIDKSTVLEAIRAVKKDYANLSNSKTSKYTPIIFRPEQKDAIERTVKQFKKHNRMLWNAKMRFGKTLSALEVIKRCGFKKTIILTHRPVVNNGWYEDFTKIFYDTDYLYGSKSNGYDVDTLNNKGKGFVYFASIQDLRGSEAVGGKFGKNDEIFNTIWDCVIVDEAHEGTKTTLGDETIKAIVKEGLKKTKLLALSGTPFNILDEYDEESIYTWDYIMEQECKSEWDKLHFGDSNPYEELPELRIYTYDLGDLLHNSNYITYEDKAFNFHEFFRTWTGDFKVDYAQMPVTAKIGDFVHEKDIWSFLNLMTKLDNKNSYPYSKDEYRQLFKHSLWMVPGVREARALKNLMTKHPVFGNGQFNIINVAGSDDEESTNALNSVKNAISEAEKIDTYTITLSCGKLTTGVTIKEWTAVFMLAGSYSTSAANYLQTIFRVQSPCNKNGMIKETAYVFDFAPDRTLKMISQAVSVSSKAGKTTDGDKQILGKFLNYCPVISISGSQMKEYQADRLLQQLKKAYADKVVRNGFDDSNLYNDELLKLDELDIKKFDELKGIIGKSKAANKQNDITVNDQGLTNKEYEEQERLKKKPKKELTEEEKAFLEELKKKKKVRNDAISILRGISIRMPLLIYGADVPYDEEITLEKFIKKVDDSSWNEFMPTGVTKEVFQEFKKYYDEDVFIAAGRRIRNIAREADTLEPTERVKKITSLFSNFKNPDKETVLTPWRVVNMHMSDCLGGYDFWDKKHEYEMDEPRFVNRGKVTAETFNNTSSKILEINSKTGLYPLYVTYSIYRAKCEDYNDDKLTLELKRIIWNDTIQNNVFVICKTPMAKQITQRTLAGYSNIKINAHYFDDLINQMEHKSQQFVERVLKPSYWKKGEVGKMKFDAIVGNPPYQIMDGGNGASARPVYNHFVDISKQLNPSYLSMIIPARWYSGGKGLDEFRKNMLNDEHITLLTDYPNGRDIFPTVDVAGGICYFLRNKIRADNCKVINCFNGKRDAMIRKLNEYNVIVRYNKGVSVINKVKFIHNDIYLDSVVSARKPFGLPTNYHPQENGIPCWFIQKIGLRFALPEDIDNSNGYLDKWKFLAPKAPIAGQTDFTKPLGFYYSGNTIISKPNECCTESFLVLYSANNVKEIENFKKYIFTKFSRFLLLQCVVSQDVTREKFRFVPMQNFTDNSDIDWDKPISNIDEQLFKKYNLSEDEISFIEEKIKSVD